MSDVDEVNGIVAEPEKLRVEIRCVVPPTEEQCGRLRAVMAQKYGRDADDVEIVIHRDPAAADGFNIFVGDDNYDWSTLGRIRQFRKTVQALPKDPEGDRIVPLIREDIAGFSLNTGYQQVGQVVSVSDSIAVIQGLRDVVYGEIVLFECGVKGMALDIRTDGTTGIVLFGDSADIVAGSRVVRTKRTAGIPISNRILGRMIDPLGNPIDGGEPIGAKKYYPLERPAPGIVQRKPVSRPLETGILSIDAMFPI